MGQVPDILAPYLESSAPNDKGEWDMHCPLHEDSRRSAQINFDAGAWYCHACDRGGSIAELMRYLGGRDPDFVRADAPSVRAVVEPEALPSEGTIRGWVAALQDNRSALDQFRQRRGLSPETIERYQIGWRTMKSGPVYTLPIRDADGGLLNVRFYDLNPSDDRRKVWGLTGRNIPVLFPVDQLSHERLVFCEGEWDALLAIQNGVPAITRTGAAKVWKRSWNPLFEGKEVFACHDMDRDGQIANRRVKRELRRIARVTAVRLPYPQTEKHGKDLTDYFHEDGHTGDEFLRMAKDTREAVDNYGKPEHTAVELIDTFDQQMYGRLVSTTVTVAGRRDPPYSMPQKVTYSCDMDNGLVCGQCPLKGDNGNKTINLDAGDPIYLAMIGQEASKIQSLLKGFMSIPKCSRVAIEEDNQVSVQELIVRPSVDGAHLRQSEGAYVNRRLFHVGGHDAGTNVTVNVVGAVHPSPRDRKNEFLVHDLMQVKTSLDSFTMTPTLYKDLERFQAPDAQLMSKLLWTANELSAVTGIQGRPELHLAMDLVYHSVLGFNVGGRPIDRGWMNLLVVGDTRTGKSETAQSLIGYYELGEMISCEGASLAGILGGLQQYGGRNEYMITWGAIPMNDRRLVVMDEVGALSLGDIEQLSSVRSSGVAKLQKIQAEATHARTRLIWLGNPRADRRHADKMSAYTHGVDAIEPLIGKQEDISRFDLAMSVAESEVGPEEINRRSSRGPARLSQASCQQLIRWVWSRKPEDVLWTPEATESMFKAANQLGDTYVTSPPLVIGADVRHKVARLATAVAGRTFSTTDGTVLVVRPAHVRAAYTIINRIYGMPGFGYLALSRERKADVAAQVEAYDEAKELLYEIKDLAHFLRNKQGKFQLTDIAVMGNISKDHAQAIISKLMGYRMVEQDGPMYVATPLFMQLLKEAK